MFGRVVYPPDNNYGCAPYASSLLQKIVMVQRLVVMRPSLVEEEAVHISVPFLQRQLFVHDKGAERPGGRWRGYDSGRHSPPLWARSRVLS